MRCVERPRLGVWNEMCVRKAGVGSDIVCVVLTVHLPPPPVPN